MPRSKLFSTLLLSLTLLEGCKSSTIQDPPQHLSSEDLTARLSPELQQSLSLTAHRVSMWTTLSDWRRQATSQIHTSAQACAPEAQPPHTDALICTLLRPPRLTPPSEVMLWKQRVERQLQDIDDIKSITVFAAQHSKSLLFKLHYKSGITALFKANHFKWDPEDDDWKSQPRSGLLPEMAVHDFTYPLTDLLIYRYPPAVKLTFDKKSLKRLVKDNRRTLADESELFKALLVGIPGRPRPFFSHPTRNLSGVAMLWIEDSDTKIPGVLPKLRRQELLHFADHFDTTLETLPPKLIHQLSNLILIDFLVMNNDRPGNMVFTNSDHVLFAIDNDNAFMAEDKKTFNRRVFQALPAYDPDLVEALRRFFLKNDENDLVRDVFGYYPPKAARKFARELRARFYDELLLEISTKHPLSDLLPSPAPP